MKKNKIIILVVLVVVLMLGIFLWSKMYGGTSENLTNNESVENIVNSWEGGSTSGVVFKYPEDLGAKYIGTSDWPPKVRVENGPLTCKEAQKKTINGVPFCVTKENEGAAGSTYTNYKYSSEKDGKVFVQTFTLRAVQCANYDDPEKTECENERNIFDVDTLASLIFDTAHLIYPDSKYFGSGTVGHLNSDEKIDTVFLVTENGGGSGTFYYVVVALSTPNGYIGTNKILLGDRIAPQTIEISRGGQNNGQIVVNYADRKPNEPMTTRPSVGVSKYFKIEDGKLVEIKK